MPCRMVTTFQAQYLRLFAGTDPLLALMGLTQVNNSQMGTDLKLSVKFTEGSHSSILDPAPTINPSAAVTTELQTQMAAFLAQDGNTLPVANARCYPGPVASNQLSHIKKQLASNRGCFFLCGLIIDIVRIQSD